MDVEKVFHGLLQADKVNAVVQMDQRRKIGRCIAPHHIGKVNLKVGERVNRADRVVHFIFL